MSGYPELSHLTPELYQSPVTSEETDLLMQHIVSAENEIMRLNLSMDVPLSTGSAGVQDPDQVFPVAQQIISLEYVYFRDPYLSIGPRQVNQRDIEAAEDAVRVFLARSKQLSAVISEGKVKSMGAVLFFLGNGRDVMEWAKSRWEPSDGISYNSTNDAVNLVISPETALERALTLLKNLRKLGGVQSA